jgi:FtsH-binding integral membrane protein
MQYASPQYGGQYGGQQGAKPFEQESESESSEIPMGLPLDGNTPAYIRTAFVRKVYSILSVQLLATCVIGYVTNSYVEEHVRMARPLYMMSFVLTLGTLCAVMCCCKSAARTFPQNYALLSLITLGMSLMVGIITAQYSMQSVLIAVAATAVIFFCLTVYACFTKTDWTGMGVYLYAGLIAMSVFGMMMWLFCMFGACPGPFMHKVYAFFGVMLFTGYIIYDTQMIVGGTHKQHSFTVDDYAFAALNLYLDIINMFVYILQLFGNRDN